MRVLQHWIDTEFEPWEKCDGSCEIGHCDPCTEWKRALHEKNECYCEVMKSDKELLKLETFIKKKCRAIDPSWWEDSLPSILEEFETKEKLPKDFDLKRQDCPKMSQCLSIMTKKLLWTEEYALEKSLPMLTRWQVKHRASGGTVEVIRPLKIVKKRILLKP